MPFRYQIACYLLFCRPLLSPAQPGYFYYVESSCTNCKPSANGKIDHYEVISDAVHSFTMDGKARELELITADFKAGLAVDYSNYAPLMDNVTVRTAPDRRTAERAREERISAMREKGYRVEERPFWFASHRAIPEVDEYLRSVARLGFDGVALIAENDWVVHRRGYGLARELGELPNGPAVAFPIGTMTKAFTAQIVLLLQETGRLRLSDNLGKIFRGIPVDKRMITIDQLLTHTSGLERDVVIEGEDSGAEVLEAILHSKLRAMPGEHYHYSNAGYQLLALIIQKMTRDPYDQLLREQILLPFQLTQTGFYHQPPGKVLIADGGMGGTPQPFHSQAALNYAYLGSEGVLMTADDLFRWFRSISKLPIFFEMTRSRLDIERSHGFSTINKMVIADGESEGYHAHLSYDPARSRLIILLSNSGLASSADIAETLTRNIRKIMDKQPVNWTKEQAMGLEGCDGLYVNGADTLQVTAHKDRLKIRFAGGRLADRIINNPGGQISADTSLQRFALPTAERTLTCFDLATEQTQKLLFSPDFREVWAANLKLERVEGE